MRSRASTPIAALATAALLSPSPAAAFNWTLRTGFEYQQGDSWNPEGDRTTIPRFDLDLSLDAGGSIGGPGVLSYAGGAQYRRSATSRDDFDQVRDQLSYRLRSTLFGNRQSPVTLTGHATRVDDSFSTEGDAAGSLLQTIYGGDLTVNAGRNRPWLRSSYTYSSSEQETLALGLSSRTVHGVSASTGHGGSNFSYNADYRANFSEGTFAFDNFEDHQVNIEATAEVAKKAKLRLGDSYFLRQPTSESQFNPRQELNSFTAMLNHLGDGSNAQNGSYQYTHGIQTVPLREDVERVLHRLGYAVTRVLPDPRWKIRGTGEASLTEDRIGTTDQRAFGQTVGGTAFWRDTSARGYVEVRGGPSVGAIEGAGVDAVFGYGGTAGVTIARTGERTTQVSYDASYERDLRGVRGWAFRQQALGGADTRLGSGMLRGTLQASSERRDSPLFGGGATRALTATTTYQLRRSTVGVTASLQDGLVGAASAGGDGLFLAPSFDSHVLSATLNGSTSPWARVTLRSHLRYSSTDVPDRPAFSESEAYVAAELSYGALRLALEDRYVITEVTDGKVRVNQVFLKAYRVFGSRF